MISSLIEWDHTEDYFVSRFEFQQDCQSGQRKVIIAIEDNPFLSGHVIDGKLRLINNLFVLFIRERQTKISNCCAVEHFCGILFQKIIS